MSDLNISILSRILSAHLQENPQLSGVVRNIIEAADGDGQPNEEDQVLSESEARTYIQRLQDRGRTLRQGHSLLSERRDSLVGTLEAAQNTLRSANASPEILQLIQAAARQDHQDQDLTLTEIQQAMQELEQVTHGLESLSSGQFFQQAEELVRDAGQLEHSHPEIFLPETQVAQRAPIELNFLKSLEEGDWRQIDGLMESARNGGTPDVTNPQTRFYMLVASLLNTAGIDYHHTEGTWQLSFENLQAAIQAMPEEARRDLRAPELEMATLRYSADQVQQDMGALQGQRLLAQPERTDLGVSLLPLINGRPNLFIEDPRLQLFRDEAGSDGILAPAELARSLRHYYVPPMQAPDSAEVMNELRVLVTAQTQATTANTAARGSHSFANEVSRLVMQDLVRMRDGFSERDLQLATDMPVDQLMELGTNVVTLGGWTTGGHTYVDVQRGLAENAESLRNSALDALRRLIEHGDRNPQYQAFLRGRSGAQAQPNIPNALAFLRQTDARSARMLDGPFFQAERIWNIRQIADADRQAQEWFNFAQALRGGYRGEGVTSMIHAVPNLAFARAILHALRRESSTPAMRIAARYAFQDSMGYDITDDQGNVNGIRNQGNGELGIWPVDWFRNYSDEGIASAPAEGGMLVASFVGAGAAWRGFRGVMTVAGRRSLATGLMEFLAVRSPSLVAAAGEGIGASTAASQGGWFSRWMASSASRRVVAAEAQLGAAVTDAERALARTAVARARNVQQILTSPLQALADTGTPGAVVAGGVRFLRYPLRGLGWMMDQGIPRYAIASQVFQRWGRARRHAMILDREYRLDLPLSNRR